jgi:hypothetical protein
VERVLAWQLREEMAELTAGGAQEAAVAGDPHQHLRDAKGHDLRVAQPAPSVTGPPRQEIIRPAINADTEKVEVGVHRGLRVVDALAAPTSTSLTWTLATTKAVASII